MAQTQTMLKLGEEYKLAVRKALRLLGKRNLSLIIHGASFPSVDEQDTGFGTYTSQGAKNLINFNKDIFNSIQLGPAGKTKAIDSSPYTGTVFSDNPLYIDLFQFIEDNHLTKKKQYAQEKSKRKYNPERTDTPASGANS